MLNKKLILLGLLLSILIITSACSNEETSNTEKENESTETTETVSDFLIVSGDTVSEQGGCVLASRFTVGDKIVFRMSAVDPSTNELVEDAKLQVHLSTGEVLDMHFAEHPPGVENAAKFWTAAYKVTEDTPTGTLGYHVTAEEGDRKGEFAPFNVQPSLLTIMDAEAVDGEGKESETE